VPFETEPLLDDIDVGELEGLPISAYRAWKRAHTRADRFPGGESLDESAARYAQAFRRLVSSDHDCVLVVCHEIPIRYAVNAAAGSTHLDGPVHDLANAVPYCFDEVALLRAADGIEHILALS
jgi:broad specificity phosphatase PhoE